jgi:hypothetical protein
MLMIPLGPKKLELQEHGGKSPAIIYWSDYIKEDKKRGNCTTHETGRLGS